MPDPDDCNVLAAAIHSQSEIIVTWNLKDFPRRVLEEHAITALSPDQFLSERFAEKRALVIAALAEQRQRMKNPPQTPAQFIESLQRQKLTRFVAALRDYEGGLQKNSSAPNFFGALLFYRINSLMSRNRTRPQQLLNFLQTRVARLVVGRFQIQAQQRLGIGRAQIKPPTAVRHIDR